jgi:hypothetical protein
MKTKYSLKNCGSDYETLKWGLDVTAISLMIPRRIHSTIRSLTIFFAKGDLGHEQ